MRSYFCFSAHSNPARYAFPSPDLAGRCRTCTRPVEAASSSASCPVPSGELSSTTSTSSRGSCWRIAGTTSGRLTRSLYVGTTTRNCSATSTADVQDGGHHGEKNHGCPGDQADCGGKPDDRGLIPENYAVLAAPGQRHTHEGMVDADDLSGDAVDFRGPGLMIAPADVQECRAAGAGPDGKGVVAIALDGGGTGAPTLAQREHWLLENSRSGRVERRRPEAGHPAGRIRLDLHVGDHRGAGHRRVIGVDGHALVGAEESEPGQLDLSRQKNVLGGEGPERTAAKEADPVLFQLGR